MGWKFFTSAGYEKVTTDYETFTGVESYSMTGNITADYTLGDSVSLLRLSTDAAGYTISGITGGTDGRILVLENVQATAGRTIILKHNSGATASNGFSCPVGQDLYVQDRSAVVLVYDGTSNRWRPMAPGTSNATPAATGTASAGTTGRPASADDHVHSLETHGASKHTDITRYVFINPSMITVDDATAINNEGTTPDIIARISFPEASLRSGALWSWMVPSDWSSGTAISVTLIWRTGTTTGNVRWLISISEIASGDDPAEVSSVAAGGDTIADSTTVKYSTLTSTITPAAAGNLLKFNLERNANVAADTATGNAFLYGVRLEYTAVQ